MAGNCRVIFRDVDNSVLDIIELFNCKPRDAMAEAISLMEQSDAYDVHLMLDLANSITIQAQ